MLGGGSLTCAADQLSSPFPGLRPSLAYPRPSPRTASPPFVPSPPRLGSHPIEAATPYEPLRVPTGGLRGARDFTFYCSRPYADAHGGVVFLFGATALARQVPCLRFYWLWE